MLLTSYIYFHPLFLTLQGKGAAWAIPSMHLVRGGYTPCGLSRVFYVIKLWEETLADVWLTLSFKSEGVNSSWWHVFKLHTKAHIVHFFLTALVQNWKMCIHVQNFYRLNVVKCRVITVFSLIFTKVCLQISASLTTSATKENIELHHYDRR